MAGAKRWISHFLLVCFFAVVFSGAFAGGCWATPTPYGEISEKDDASIRDASRLDAVFSEIVARPEFPEGPARIEGADYYLHEIIRDENWGEWARFRATSRTIIPTTSARFFVYANVALAKLKRPGVLVILERKAPQEKTSSQPSVKRIQRTHQTMDSFGLIQRGIAKRQERGWDIGSFFDVDTEVTAAVDRDWDFWFVAQKFFLVAGCIVGGLIFIEFLRLIFGAGARVLGAGASRSDSFRRKKKKRRA